MPDSVFFSIVVPTYNRSHLLQLTLQSLLTQDYQSYEIIVVDDGGADNTKSMIESLQEPRIRYYWKENGERGAARNYGLAQAKGKWVNFFDSDDLAYPNHLRIAYQLIQEHPDIGVFHNAYDVKQQGSALIRHDQFEGPINKHIIKRNIFTCNGVFVRRDLLDEVRFTTNREMTNGEDWLLWLQLAARNTIWAGSIITSSIIQHDNRSMVTAQGDKMLRSARLFETELRADKVFATEYAGHVKSAVAEMYSLAALGYSIEKRRKSALKWLMYSLALDISRTFTRRTAAIIRRLIS
jgi:glycosyltransferase involved in cell wall biosynthesis